MLNHIIHNRKSKIKRGKKFKSTTRRTVCLMTKRYRKQDTQVHNTYNLTTTTLNNIIIYINIIIIYFYHYYD